MARQPYCNPWNAGLASETPAVCRRLQRLIKALSVEINDQVVRGQIADDVRNFRLKIWRKLQRDGWEVSWHEKGDGACRVKAPKSMKGWPA